MPAPIGKSYPVDGTHDVRQGDEIRFVERSNSGQPRRVDAIVNRQLMHNDGFNYKEVFELTITGSKGPGAPKVGDETLRNISHLRECGVARKQRRNELGVPNILRSLPPFNRSLGSFWDKIQ